jgi:hypothetical protein
MRAELTKQLDLLVDALRLHQQAAKVMPVPVPLAPMLIRLHRDHGGTGKSQRSDPAYTPHRCGSHERSCPVGGHPAQSCPQCAQIYGSGRASARRMPPARVTGAYRNSWIPVSGSPQTRLQGCSMPFIGWIRARPTAWALACSSSAGRSTSWATASRFAQPSATGHASRSWPKLRLRSSLEAMRWRFKADR